jgi:hypothetical protein
MKIRSVKSIQIKNSLQQNRVQHLVKFTTNFDIKKHHRLRCSQSITIKEKSFNMMTKTFKIMLKEKL